MIETTNITPLPGLHYGVPFEDYARWDAINFSRLKEIRNTASKCKWNMDHPKETTRAMKMGSALHIATLEPARFESSFLIVPPCDRRTAEGKSAWAEYERQAAGKLIIREGAKDDESTLDEIGRLRGMAKSIHNSKVASHFLGGEGQNEVSMLWRDETTGLLCKGRMDRFLSSFARLGGIPVIVELKKTKDAREWSFGKDANNMGYAEQAANYICGVKSITGAQKVAHVFIVVEEAPPHDMKVYVLDDASLQTGHLRYREWLDHYAECVKSGDWPGYEDKLEILPLPQYAVEAATQ